MEQSRDELVEHLAEQADFLRRSAAAFDGGARHESKRLALTTRVLLHETRVSRSLIGQLASLDSFLMADRTSGPVPENASFVFSLVSVCAAPEGGVATRPSLGSPRRQTLFPAWWSAVVAASGPAVRMTRADVVLHLSHKDGGGHVDPTLPERWHAFTRVNVVSFNVDESLDDGTAVTRPDRTEPPASLMMRTIADEVLWTIDHSGLL